MSGGASDGGRDRAYVDRPLADRAAAARAADVAADEWGLDDPELLRMGMNGIYAAGDAILRISTPTVDAVWSIDLARVLLDAGLRVARPARSEALTVDDVQVTCWERVHDSGEPIDWGSVGRMVRRLHSIGIDEVPASYPVASPAALPWWDFDALLAETGEAIDPAALRGLEAAVERWCGWDRFDEPVLCHGDVHPGNVVMADDGPVLIDWDLLCRAPAGWDHAPLMTWGERWGGSGAEYPDFVSGYGRSMRGDPAARAFAELRLVAATLMRVRAGIERPEAMIEARRRLRYWAGERPAPMWQAQ